MHVGGMEYKYIYNHMPGIDKWTELNVIGIPLSSRNQDNANDWGSSTNELALNDGLEINRVNWNSSTSCSGQANLDTIVLDAGRPSI